MVVLRITAAMAALLVLPGGSAGGEEPVSDAAVANPEVAQLVRSGLEAGLAGKEKLRREKLEEATAAAPGAAAPRWHLGQVRVGDEWLTIAEAEATALKDSKLRAYVRQRERHGGTLEGVARLAAWCQRNGLIEQSRAHWYQVLRHDPRNKKALMALGAEWYGSTLLSKEAAGHQRAYDGRIRDDLKELQPKLKKLREAVLEGDDDERASALAELRLTRGNVAVVVISEVLLRPTDDEELTEKLHAEAVKILGTLEDPEATRILVWHAAMSPYESVRKAATQQLSLLPMHEYVPILLAGLEMPLEVSVNTRQQGGRPARRCPSSAKALRASSIKTARRRIRILAGKCTARSTTWGTCIASGSRTARS